MSRLAATVGIVAIQAALVAGAYTVLDARAQVVGMCIGNLWVFVLPMWRKGGRS